MKNLATTAMCAAIALAMASCSSKETPALTESGLDPAAFVAEVDGKPTALYTLRSSDGMEACITNYGARIVSLMVPDRDGKLRDVVLGFDSIAAYLPENNKSDFSAAIGRYANRIGGGRFVLDGDTVVLPQNNFGHCLHGGPTGWQYQVYTAELLNDTTVRMSIVSPDGDNNFPGTVNASVTYTVLPGNKLDIAYEATTDKPTVINMTNHAYFNLAGDPTKDILDHTLAINASAFTPVDSTFMTTGEIRPVEGTPMDFRTAKAVGVDIDADDEQVRNGMGFDHNWVLDTAGDINLPACVLASPVSGIVLTVYTDEPGVQFYAGNFLDGGVTGKKGIVYNRRTGMCLETQHYPDSPNKPEWPTTVLRPGETYRSNTIFAFSTDAE